MRALPVTLMMCLCALPASAKYSGGTGEPNDPYQIATTADLIALGETPEDYDKHFILTADIDLDPNLPGSKVFDRAVIAPDTDTGNSGFQGTAFTGTFDGHGQTISNLTIAGQGYLGLFGQLGSGAEVRSLRIAGANIIGSGYVVGGLVGSNFGDLTCCNSTGRITGNTAGGLVGSNAGTVTQSFSTGTVGGTGEWFQIIGGLVGVNGGTVTQCYSTGAVSGLYAVGGLVAVNRADVVNCYSAGAVRGSEGSDVGGLVGNNMDCDWLWGCRTGVATQCFWDTEASGQTTSAGGEGRTTAEMQTVATFTEAGWDFVGPADGPSDLWAEPEGGGYPVLWWQLAQWPSLPAFSGGTGQADDPYLISTAVELNSIGSNPRLMNSHFKLVADVDLTGVDFYAIGDEGSAYTGAFDGNAHTIANLAYDSNGVDHVGLFGYVHGGAIRNLGLIGASIDAGTGSYVGPLVGRLVEGTVANCYASDGVVSGSGSVGGLVGASEGALSQCYSTGVVSGTQNVGGLVGLERNGPVTQCYSTGAVDGNDCVGGLVGGNCGPVTQCYSTGVVTGESSIGGLVGFNYNTGIVAQCYNTGAVSSTKWYVGGLVGHNDGTVTQCYSAGALSGAGGAVGGLVGINEGDVLDSVWDIETSGRSGSDRGIGLTTAEMMDPNMLGLNGFANDPNWVLDAGHDYPRLAWQGTTGRIVPEPAVDWLEGSGTAEAPYRIDTAGQLILLGKASLLWDRRFVLGADLDLDPNLPGRSVFGQAVIQDFAGVFDGGGHTISNLTIQGRGTLGLFGQLESGAQVHGLGVLSAKITGPDHCVGGLVGQSHGGTVTQCYSTGDVAGSGWVGGLVGLSRGDTVTWCYSTGAVSGSNYVGGLVGQNLYSSIAASCSSGSVTGRWHVGGLVGANIGGSISNSYNAGSVCGDSYVGGLMGENDGTVTQCYSTGAVSGTYDVGGLVGVYSHSAVVTRSFYDTQTSGQAASAGGLGETTAEMQTASTFLDAGWDFVGETANGTEDIWWIDEGKDYPRLWWEAGDEASQS